MPLPLEIDSQNQLREHREMPAVSPAIKNIAKLVSFIFHPVFIPIYVMGFLLYVHPYVFAGFNSWNKKIVLIQSLAMFTFFPLVTVLLLRGLKFIDTIYLKTQRDRIIPYTACMIWYFWVAYVWFNLPDFPIEPVYYAGGIFIASFAGLMGNVVMKVSMHTVALGVSLTFLFILAFTGEISFGIYLAVAVLIAGLVSTARLLSSDHTNKEIYTGLVLGALSMLFSRWMIAFLG